MGTELTRRHFARLCAALGTVPLAGFASASGPPVLLSAYRDPSGSFGVAALDDAGTILFTEALPGRGHDTVVAPDGRTAVTFARRPGRFALVFDVEQERAPFAFEAAPQRHFYGHGFFSCDGALLLATENDYAGERGVVGVYDVQARYRRIGEFETHGIGPHEALLLADGRTIAVANGGILTHPNHPRQKLNLPTMAPSLSYVDLETGYLAEQVSLPPELHQLSIRHLTQTADGAVWFGGQYEGNPTDDVPLVGRHQRGEHITMVTLAPGIQRRLRQYVGSIKASPDGSRIALTSPRGGIWVEIVAGSRAVSATTSLNDVCGVAPLSGSFVATSGRGQITVEAAMMSDLNWDNHLSALHLSRLTVGATE